LPFITGVGVIVFASLQTLAVNLINPNYTATALSITSITSEYGPVAGGQTVTITGDFGVSANPQISAGNNHTLALDSNGQLWAWGYNWLGQFGNGTTTSSSIPVAIDMSETFADRNIVQIVASCNEHSLALDSEGQIWAWGWGSEGQLGNGTNTSSNVPVAVDMTGALAGRTIIQVAAGWGHSLALDSEGQVFAWGSNWYGQLGDGTNTSSNVPVTVDVSGMFAGRDIIQIATASAHSLALDNDGSIFTWGRGIEGQLGNNTNTGSNVPVAVDMTGVLAGSDIVQVEGGGSFSFALDSAGRVFSWGWGLNGELGNGASVNVNIPTAVDISGVLAGRTIVRVASGRQHALAIDSEGQIFTWGLNSSGQLGNGTIGGIYNTPVVVDMTGVLASSDVVQIAGAFGSGLGRSVALDSEGNVFAWGSNWNGQLGNGTSGWNAYSAVPVFIMNLGVPTNPIQSVTLGGLYCTNIQVIDPNTITCIVPAHPAGTVDVVVNTLHGSATLYQGYTYVDIPDVPNTGHGMA